MKLVSLTVAALLALSPITAEAAPNYDPIGVWNVSGIEVMPGQMDNYIAYLADSWKKQRAFAAREGAENGYHVLLQNNPRAGEPNLILITTSKDFISLAQGEALTQKMLAEMATDRTKMQAGAAERTAMRKQLTSSEYTEIRLK